MTTSNVAGTDPPPKIWEGGECWIIGGGYSLIEQFNVPYKIYQQIDGGALPFSALSPYLSPIHDKHVIGVNSAYLIGPWIDVVYFGDCSFYNWHRERLSQFRGLKYSSCPRFRGNKKPGIKFLEKNREKRIGLTTDKRTLSWNYHSGGAVINLAAHFGVRRVILVGFDMVSGSNGETHWHGGHKEKAQQRRDNRVPTPPFRRHMKGFSTIAKDAENLDIEIINANPKSKITQFPRYAVSELLEGEMAEG